MLFSITINGCGLLTFQFLEMSLNDDYINSAKVHKQDVKIWLFQKKKKNKLNVLYNNQINWIDFK